jgi:hypothetical protein
VRGRSEGGSDGAGGLGCGGGRSRQDLDLAGGMVGQRVHLQVGPGRLDRIEFGSIGRQQPRSPVELRAQKVSHLDRAVHGGPTPASPARRAGAPGRGETRRFRASGCWRLDSSGSRTVDDLDWAIRTVPRRPKPSYGNARAGATPASAPAATSCAAPAAPSAGPFHRGRRSKPSAGRLFFNARPLALDPGLDPLWWSGSMPRSPSGGAMR